MKKKRRKHCERHRSRPAHLERHPLLEQLNIIKMLDLHVVICKLHMIPIKIPRSFRLELRDLIVTFTWENQTSKSNQEHTLKTNKGNQPKRTGTTCSVSLQKCKLLNSLLRRCVSNYSVVFIATVKLCYGYCRTEPRADVFMVLRTKANINMKWVRPERTLRGQAKI